MSVDVQLLVWTCAPASLTDLQRLVLARLALYADDAGGQCYPSIRTLAEEMGREQRSIQRCVRALAAAKFIDVQVGSGPHGTNHYQINLAVLRAGSQGDRSVRGDDRGVRVTVVSGGMTEECRGGDTTVPGGVTGGSPNSNNKQERQKKGSSQPKRKNSPHKDESVSTVEIPSWLPDEVAQAFQEMRQRIKKPLTAFAWRTILGKLQRCHDEGNDAIECIQNSIVNCWQDVYTDRAKPRKKEWKVSTDEREIWPEFFGKERVQ